MNHKTDMQAVLLDAMRVISESADEIKAGCAIDDEWPDAEDKAEYDRRVAVLERARALASQSAGVPDGWKIIRVNDHFDALIASLERAESKGYLPDAIAEEWGNFACDENIAAPAAPALVSEPEQAFQARVKPWMLECFGSEIAADTVERNHRFFEEASELVQSCGMTASEAHQLVDYTWGRPVGEKSQEVGGVMVTIAALCLANGLDMHTAGEVELARISAPEMMAKIRAKQAAKPKHSPLPEARASAPQAVARGVALDGIEAFLRKCASECQRLSQIDTDMNYWDAGLRLVEAAEILRDMPECAAPAPDREQVGGEKEKPSNDDWLDDVRRAIRVYAHACCYEKSGVPAASAEIERLLAALAAAPAPAGQSAAVPVWMPIETAPKTGRTLLLGYPNTLGKWRTTRGKWMSENYIAEYWEEPDDAEPGWYETPVEAEDIPNCWYIEPTHWMSLPPAPAAPAPVSSPADVPEGCTPTDAEMLRAANHALGAEIDRLKRRLRPFAQLASSPLSWAMVEYCIADDPEKKTLQAPQMQRAFNRAVEAFNENTEQQPMPMMDFGESGLVAEMLEALEAVVSVADRATIEFDKARAAIERARTARNAGASPSRERGERPIEPEDIDAVAEAIQRETSVEWLIASRAAVAAIDTLIARGNHASEHGEQDCPHGVDDGACKQCYGEKAALAANQCVHDKGIVGDDGGTPCCPITMTPDASAATLGDAVSIAALIDAIDDMLKEDTDVEFSVHSERVAGWTAALDQLKIEVLPRLSAPQPQAVEPNGLTDDARECLMDVVSHYDNIVAGFDAHRLSACAAQNGDEAAYWTREINVAKRMKVQAERALAASAPTLTTERDAFENWWNAKLAAGEASIDIAFHMFVELTADSVQPQAAELKGCPRCTSSTAAGCNDIGCGYLDAGSGEPNSAEPKGLYFKRSPFRGGWTTFNIRDEDADEAERRLLAKNGGGNDK